MREVFRYGKKIIGEYEDRVLYKAVSYSKHHLHKYKAWGIDSSIIDRCKEAGCDKIVIKEREQKRYYEIPFNLFLEKCFVINLGFGKQLACSDDNFKLQDKNQLSLTNDR